SCYCPEKEFVTEVVGCLDAWGQSDEEISRAIKYFTGLCAPHADPAPIVSAIPSTVSLPPAASVPVTTIVATLTETIPCEPTTITQGPSSGVVVTETTQIATTSITVPAVTINPSEPTLAYPTQ